RSLSPPPARFWTFAVGGATTVAERATLAVRRQKQRVVVRTEAGDPATEHEELDARSSRRSGHDDHDVAAYFLETPVAVGAHGGVAEDPAAARPLARKADRSMVRLPRTRSTPREPRQGRIAGFDEQADGCVCLTAKDRLG